MANDQIPFSEWSDMRADSVSYQSAADVLDFEIPPDVSNHEPADHGDRAREQYWRTAPGDSIYGHEHQFRLEETKPAHTVTASNPDWHPSKPRALTIREQARLQSFPDDFEFMGTKSSQQRQVGNAVPPKLAYAIATTIDQIRNRASISSKDEKQEGEEQGENERIESNDVENGSIVTKEVNGYGPYMYRVTHNSDGSDDWEYLGRADGKGAYDIRESKSTDQEESQENRK